MARRYFAKEMAGASHGDQVAESAEAHIFAAEIGAEVPEVDLHGMDRLDAERHISQTVDEAFMNGERVVRIVHGVGQGILREAARKLLDEHPLVETWKAASGTQRTGVTYAVIEKRL